MYARANSRPMPEGFAEDAFEMTTNELRAKYRCGSTTVQRWRCEVGNPGLTRPFRPPTWRRLRRP